MPVSTPGRIGATPGLRHPADPKRLRWRLARERGGKMTLVVHSDAETIQMRLLSAPKSRLWAQSRCNGGDVTLYCRAALGAAKVRGWLGVGEGVILFAADDDQYIELLVSPTYVTELVRDDDLGTVDVRYATTKPRAAIFAVNKQRLDDVVEALVSACDPTKPNQPRSSRMPEERHLSPPRPINPIPLLNDQMVATLLAPTPSVIDIRKEFGPLSDDAILQLNAGRTVSEGVNAMKWGAGDSLLSMAVGEAGVVALRSFVGCLVDVAEVTLETPNGGFLNEILEHIRVPDGFTAGEVLRVQSMGLVSDSGIPGMLHIEALLMRLLTQEGPDLDRLMGYIDVPQQRDGWQSYEEVYRGRRNVSLHASICEAAGLGVVSLVNGQQINAAHPVAAYANLLCYTLASVKPLPIGAVLHRPCIASRSTVSNLQTLTAGSLISWAAPVCCTTDFTLATASLPLGEQFNNVLFTITGSIRALRTQKLSQYPEDKEYMLPPLAVFKVQQVVQTGEYLSVEMTYRGTAASGDDKLERRIRRLMRELPECDAALRMQRRESLCEDEETEERNSILMQEEDARRALSAVLYSTPPPVRAPSTQRSRSLEAHEATSIQKKASRSSLRNSLEAHEAMSVQKRMSRSNLRNSLEAHEASSVQAQAKPPIIPVLALKPRNDASPTSSPRQNSRGPASLGASSYVDHPDFLATQTQPEAVEKNLSPTHLESPRLPMRTLSPRSPRSPTNLSPRSPRSPRSPSPIGLLGVKSPQLLCISTPPLRASSIRSVRSSVRGESVRIARQDTVPSSRGASPVGESSDDGQSVSSYHAPPSPTTNRTNPSQHGSFMSRKQSGSRAGRTASPVSSEASYASPPPLPPPGVRGRSASPGRGGGGGGGVVIMPVDVSPRRAAASLVVFDPSTEEATLREAAGIIRNQADTIERLEWQLNGMSQIVQQTENSELLQKLEELNQQKCELISERDVLKRTAAHEGGSSVRHELLMATPPSELDNVSSTELRQRLFACQRENRRLADEALNNRTQAERALRDRVHDSVRADLETQRRTLGTNRSTLAALPMDDLVERIATLSFENALLSERLQVQTNADALQARLDVCEEENRGLLLELERRDPVMVQQLRAAARIEAGLPPAPEVETDILVERGTADELGIVHDDDDWRVVADVIPKTPAAVAGVSPGALILAVDRVTMEPEDEDLFIRATLKPSFYLTVSETKMTLCPASYIDQLAKAVSGIKVAIAASDAGYALNVTHPLLQNQEALNNAWTSVETSCETLRQLYLLRKSMREK